jgi:hypothetical protein
MSAEFNWWLLIVGLVVGAGLTWLVVADARRREEDLAEADLAAETAWLESAAADLGTAVDAAAVEQVLRLHRSYLGLDVEAVTVEPGEDDAPDTWWTRLDHDDSASMADDPAETASTADAPDPSSPPGSRREPDSPAGTPG